MVKSIEKIHSVEELAAAIGAAHNTIESVSRTIYKGTDCGASVMLTVEGKAKPTRFKVVFGDSIFGPVALSWQKAGKGTWHRFDNAPERLRQFINPYAPNTMIGPGKDMLRVAETCGKTLAAVRKASEEHVKWLPRKHDTGWITVDVVSTKPAVMISSIVEGVDYDAESQTIAFPFTYNQFWKAVQAVEDSAKAIWEETHGCVECGDEDPMTGYRAINPDCKACKGQGTII